MKSCSANRCNAQAPPPFAIKWSDEHLVLRSFESSMWHPGILHTTCQHRRMLHVKNAKFLQSTTSGCQYRRQINPETCPLFCDMDVVFICFFLLNHVLSCFFLITARGRPWLKRCPPLQRTSRRSWRPWRSTPRLLGEASWDLGQLSSFKSHKISYRRDCCIIQWIIQMV